MSKTLCMLGLSPRLEAIFQMLLPGQPVWDICCDHGLIGLVGYQSQIFPEIVFVDKVEAIIGELSRRFADEFESPMNKTQVRFFSCEAQNLNEIIKGNLIIAGVGARSITKIIKKLVTGQPE